MWRSLKALGLLTALGCVSKPVTYTPEEFEAKRATWIQYLQLAQSNCQINDDISCAEGVIFVADYILNDGKDALSLDLYEKIWTDEQNLRKEYGIEGNIQSYLREKGIESEVPELASIPKTPSELAEDHAQHRAAYEGQQEFAAAAGNIAVGVLSVLSAAEGAHTSGTEIQRQQQEQQWQWQQQADQMRRQTEQQNRAWCRQNAGAPACAW